MATTLLSLKALGQTELQLLILSFFIHFTFNSNSIVFFETFFENFKSAKLFVSHIKWKEPAQP